MYCVTKKKKKKKKQWFGNGAGVGGAWFHLAVRGAGDVPNVLGAVRMLLPSFFTTFIQDYFPLAGDQYQSLLEAPPPIVEWWGARFPNVLTLRDAAADPFVAWQRSATGGAWAAALTQHLEDVLEEEGQLGDAIYRFFVECGDRNGVARDAPPTVASLPGWVVRWCREQGYTTAGYGSSSEEEEPPPQAVGARRSGRVRRPAPLPTDLPPLVHQGPGGLAGPREAPAGRRGRGS